MVLCLGLLYHFNFPDSIRLLERIVEVCERLGVIDTHVNLGVSRAYSDGTRVYRGRDYIEHASHTTGRDREQSRWASLDNARSVWFTRASTLNAIMDVGFTSVYECEVPAEPSKTLDRRMFAAVKGIPIEFPATRGSDGLDSARVPEHRSRATLVRNHAPGTNLIKQLMHEVN